MVNKRKNLVAQAKRNVRKVNPGRLVTPSGHSRGGRQAKTAAFSLWPDDVAWIEQAAADLKTGQLRQANRSTVVQEAIRRLREDLSGKTPQEMAEDVSSRQARRLREGNL
jgi:hypothetical protein